MTFLIYKLYKIYIYFVLILQKIHLTERWGPFLSMVCTLAWPFWHRFFMFSTVLPDVSKLASKWHSFSQNMPNLAIFSNKWSKHAFSDPSTNHMSFYRKTVKMAFFTVKYIILYDWTRVFAVLPWCPLSAIENGHVWQPKYMPNMPKYLKYMP